MIPPAGRALGERPVRTMNVIVLDVLTQDQPQVPLAGYQHAVQVIPTSGRSRTSHQIPAMTRSVSVAVGCLLVSAIAFLLGCSNMAVPLPPTVTVPACRPPLIRYRPRR
jgi:hypothetical protein